MKFHLGNLARPVHSFALTTALLITLTICDGQPLVAQTQAPGSYTQSSRRRTPLVSAVAKVRPAVVNLRGKKTLRTPRNNAGTPTQAVRQVNGMGTGVIIDASGYILTNFHVVQDVKHIHVTLADGTTTTGKLIAHDNKTDLALIKISSEKTLTTIPLGTSSDVMLAETVAALGNAYGYEDTVTRGIISEIGRTVQVTDEQVYNNLLQTDAPINPGNSGGPLINLDGEMIGINVAVRVGAQGIAFAIPVNDAMEVAATFLNQLTERAVKHGIVARTIYINHRPVTQVQAVADFSSAESAGLQYGDLIRSIDGVSCQRAIDLHKGMLDKKPGDSLQLEVERDGTVLNMRLDLGTNKSTETISVWRQLGVKCSAVSNLEKIHPDYSKGLKIESVRPGSPAEKEGLQVGDVLVVMNLWKTETIDHLRSILSHKDVRDGSEVVFYIIRGTEPFFGNIRAAE